MATTLLLVSGVLPATSGGLSASLSAALSGARPAHIWLLEVDGPDGTTYRYSMGGYSSTGSGHYEGRLKAIGPITEQASDRDGRVSAMETTVRIEDTTRAWQQLAEGVYGDDLRGSAARIYLAHPDVARASWFTAFSGEIVRPKDYPEPLVAELRLRVRDAPLMRKAPHSESTITLGDWPRARADIVGRAYPWIYGEHSAQNTSGIGAVPLYPVDVAAGKWLVCAGRPKSIDRLYVDGDPKDLTTHYTLSYPIVGGKLCTIVTFTVGNIPTETAAVTIDAKGYEAVGDGSGTLIEEPLALLEHLLSNWVFGSYKSGAWLGASTRLHADSFDSSYWSARGYAAAYYQAEHLSGYEILAAWLRTHEAAAWWRFDGTLAIGVEDPTSDIPTDTEPWVRGDYHDLGNPVFSEDDAVVASAFKASHLYDPAQQKFLASVIAQDPRAEEDVLETVEYQFSAATA